MATHWLRLNSSVAALAAAALIWIPSAVSSAHSAPSGGGGRQLTVPILMYHRIDYLRPGLPEITRRLTVDPTDFEHQMEWLNEHGFHSLTQQALRDALLDGRPLPRKPILITFDDGYRDVLGKASPVIARLGMHATEYVISNRLFGTDSSFLTVPELHLLEQRGIQIGSHTETHAQLTALSDAHALQELTTSKHVLEQALDHPVVWFAYPYGAYDDHVAGLVAQAGYQLAVTTKPGSCQDSNNPLELKRFEVLDTTGVHGLASMLSSGC
jgi:peptidoglycan/xylan/chitin deacetylase (PgdA/CDA1 family)